MKTRLSPTENHKHIMSQTVPLLSYDGGDVRKWQGRLRSKLRKLLGDMPNSTCALKPKTLWKSEHPPGTIEKIVFTAEPYSDVVASVCLPKDVKPPYPFVICLQGRPDANMWRSVHGRDTIPCQTT